MKESFSRYERDNGPDVIVGGTLEERSKARSDFLKTMEAFNKLEPSSFERKPTPEEAEVISEILKRIPKFVKEYGAGQERSISPAQIHILDDSEFQTGEVEKFLKATGSGGYSPGKARITVVADQSLVKTAHVIVHELMHANAFLSTTLKEDSDGVKKLFPRRIGTSVFEQSDPQKMLFRFREEALIEELTKRFCQRYFPEIPLLKDSFPEFDHQDDLSDFMSIVREMGNPKCMYGGYRDDRILFVSLLEEIYESNRDQFDSFEDVFKVFSRADFSGNILPVARLITRIPDSGIKAFRKEGEKTMKVKDPGSAVKAILADLEAEEPSGVLSPDSAANQKDKGQKVDLTQAPNEYIKEDTKPDPTPYDAIYGEGGIDWSKHEDEEL